MTSSHPFSSIAVTHALSSPSGARASVAVDSTFVLDVGECPEKKWRTSMALIMLAVTALFSARTGSSPLMTSFMLALPLEHHSSQMADSYGLVYPATVP